MKKILILGGNRFMGRLLIEELMARGDTNITLFNRGKTNTHLFPTLRKIHGDRNTNDIQKLGKESWDIVLDFSCYQPDSLKNLLATLKGKTKRFIFISTVSVYTETEEVNKTEESPIYQCTTDQWKEEAITWENYGPKKAACEQLLNDADWLESTLLRPSIVYGQYDYTDRLYYWLYRVKTQDQFIVPDHGEELSNLTFCNDFIRILLRSIDEVLPNRIYNCTTHEANSLMDKIGTMAKVMEQSPSLFFLPKEKILAEESLKGIQIWRQNDCLTFSPSLLEKDLNFEFTSFEESIKSTIDFHAQLNQWEEGSAGLRIADELNFIKKRNQL